MSTPGSTPTPPAGTGSNADDVGPSPGPSILYAAPATAPQLVNTGIWTAPPILVSGASAYRQGEYLYQDFLYDDHGAMGVKDATQPNESNANAVALTAGTYSYPTNAQKYAGNAADLVEFRMKFTPDGTGTAYRVTLNTMVDSSAYAFTIALGGVAGTTYTVPHGANVVEPAQVFVTVHGTTAEAVDAASGHVLPGTGPSVTVDTVHRQVQVVVPFASFDPRGNTALRVAVAVGLWNPATNSYLVPAATSSATSPGGGLGLSPAAFFNVGFRHNEPSLGNNASNLFTDWREDAQATALAAGDVSAFADSVDMNKLAANVNDDMPGQLQGVPRTGHLNRILASHFEPFQGRSFAGCNGATTYCPPEYGSALQPYSVYIPKEASPPKGYPLTLLLHSLSVNYNQFANTRNEEQFSERSVPSIVFTTEGRGPDNWYYNLAEADVFETWADIAQHYPINSASVALTGYSMGGYATFKLGTKYPDLFGKMQPTVGPTFVGTDAAGSMGVTDTLLMFATLRNLPIVSWHAAADELVQPPFEVLEEQKLSALSLDFQFDLFTPAEHNTLALNDQFSPAATFLGTVANNINPPHISYVRNTTMDSVQYGIVADHAYWASNITERDGSKTYGTIDVFSHGFGIGDPQSSGTLPVSGSLPAGTIPGCCTFTGFQNAHTAPPSIAVSDILTITASNIAAIAITPSRAKVDCNATLDVTTDGPLNVTLQGCGVQSFAKGHALRRTGRLGEPSFPKRVLTI